MGDGAAVVEDRDVVARDAAGGEDQPTKRVQRCSATRQDNGSGIERGDRVRQTGGVGVGRQGQRAQTRAAQDQLQRLGVQRLRLRRPGGVEDQDAFETLRALVHQLQGSGYQDRHGNPIEMNIPYRDALALVELREKS